MSEELEKLIIRVRKIEMSPSELRQHRRSFVYGNTHIENSLITREMVDEADKKQQEEQKKDK